MSYLASPDRTPPRPYPAAPPGSPELDIQPLDAPLGAEILGLDARQPIPPAHALAIRQALQTHHIVILRDQILSDADFLRLATTFGTIYAPPRDAPVLGAHEDGTVPDIVAVANVDGGVLGHDELSAHADHQWTPQPSAGSLLYALEVPSAGGNTSWYNLALAYETLDAATRAEIDTLQLITYNPFLRRRHPLPDQRRARYRTADITPLSPWVAHPLVRTHPDTGKRLLYLGAATEVEVVGYPEARGIALVERLREHLRTAPIAYEHHWRVGDIVYWDNQITLHSRSGFDAQERRVMKRISLAGARPF